MFNFYNFLKKHYEISKTNFRFVEDKNSLECINGSNATFSGVCGDGSTEALGGCQNGIGDKYVCSD